MASPKAKSRSKARAAARLGAEASAPPRFPGAEGTVKTSAAWLIDRAGFAKGHGLPGPAALSSKHTLALVHRGGGRTRRPRLLLHAREHPLRPDP